MKKVTKKKMTIDDLAGTVSGLSGNVNDLTGTVNDLSSTVNNLSETVNNLAIMTAKGFERMDSKFNALEDKVEEIDKNTKATRRDMLNMGDKFVTHHMFDELASRVYLLEKKKQK